MLEARQTTHPTPPPQPPTPTRRIRTRDEADKLRDRKQRKIKYQRRRTAGFCGYGYCSKKPKHGHAQCEEHLAQMSQRAQERRKEREASGLCLWCGKLLQFWGTKCILCRQLFTKDPLPAGAKRALREYRKAEAQREQAQRQAAERYAILELIGSGQVRGDSAEALRLRAGIEFSKRRSYREVGELMNLSGEAVRQLLLPARAALIERLPGVLASRSTRFTEQTKEEPSCSSCCVSAANLLEDGSYYV